MTSYHFSNFPKASVAFGNYFRATDWRNLKQQLSVLQAFEMATPKHRETYTLTAGKFAPVFTVMAVLLENADKVYERKRVDPECFPKVILEGILTVLKLCLRNIQNVRTSETQKLGELPRIFSNLEELLPVFAKEDSIFRKRYYQGAPLFVIFSVFLKAFCLIAERTTNYNISPLQSLNQNYQKVLDWYRIRCIGRRMASCYVHPMLHNVLSLLIGDWTNDWDRHYEIYKNYYKENVWVPWLTYGENLGGRGWRLWCGWVTYCNLIDTWDTRPHDEVEFEQFVIENTSANFFWKGEVQYHRDVLSEYRHRVEKVMLDFFDDVSFVPKNEAS